MEKSRWLALDYARGLAVLGMILVVSPGSWIHRFEQLDHANWNGWTLADLVMPLFLFCVGVAIAIKAFGDNKNDIDLLKCSKRTFFLILIGLALNWLESLSISSIRIPGILQRIAVCYFLACLITYPIRKNNHVIMWLVIALLSICFSNYILMNWLVIGGNEFGELTFEQNLPAIIDRALFGVNHLWIWGKNEAGQVVYDPDGLLTTVFATANVLAGMLFFLLRKKLSVQNKRNYFTLTFACAMLILFIAFLLNEHGILINKKLWSISFTLLGMGFCMIVLLVFSLVPSISQSFKYVANLNPLIVFGSNAILAFSISIVMLIYSGKPLSVLGELGIQTYVFEHVIRLIQEPYWASLFCALMVAFCIYLLLLPLHIKKIFIRL